MGKRTGGPVGARPFVRSGRKPLPADGDDVRTCASLALLFFLLLCLWDGSLEKSPSVLYGHLRLEEAVPRRFRFCVISSHLATCLRCSIVRPSASSGSFFPRSLAFSRNSHHLRLIITSCLGSRFRFIVFIRNALGNRTLYCSGMLGFFYFALLYLASTALYTEAL